MKLKVGKLLVRSRKNGLLASNLNISLIAAAVLVVAAIAVILGLNIRPVEPVPELRYSVSLEESGFGLNADFYDRGSWYRPFMILLFAGIATAMNIYIAGVLLAQKWSNIATAVLLINVFIMTICLVISFNITQIYSEEIAYVLKNTSGVL